MSLYEHHGAIVRGLSERQAVANTSLPQPCTMARRHGAAPPRISELLIAVDRFPVGQYALLPGWQSLIRKDLFLLDLGCHDRLTFLFCSFGCENHLLILLEMLFLDRRTDKE